MYLSFFFLFRLSPTSGFVIQTMLEKVRDEIEIKKVKVKRKRSQRKCMKKKKPKEAHDKDITKPLILDRHFLHKFQRQIDVESTVPQD